MQIGVLNCKPSRALLLNNYTASEFNMVISCDFFPIILSELLGQILVIRKLNVNGCNSV